MKLRFSISGFTGIILLVVLVAPVLITFYWLQHRKSVIRHEIGCRMIEGISRDELLLLKFTREESAALLSWEHSGEFEYHGQMYDVVETGEKGDTLYFWCWWDHDETRLNREFAGLVSRAFREDPQKKEKQEQLNSYFKSLYCSNLFNWNSMAPSPEVRGSCICIQFFFSLSIPPPKPPPRLS
jgi:hypothetical protein